MDQLVRTATPESVDLTFEPAGLGSRFLALFLDGLIQAVFLIMLFFLTVTVMGISLFRLDAFEQSVSGMVAVVIILALLGPSLYYILFESLWRGQTPGKRIMRLRVLRADGRPAEFAQIVGRNLLRLIDMLPIYYCVGVVSILLTRHSQRLGDLAAGTVVVREPRPSLLRVPRRLGRPPSVNAVALQERAARLTDAELEPVRAFISRRTSLNPDVRASLAHRLSGAVAQRIGWTDPVPNGEHFLEEVLWLRAGGNPNDPG